MAIRFLIEGEQSAGSVAVFLGSDYFREFAAILNAAVSGPPDPAAIGAVMRRHGLTPAPAQS
jgi:hypothetical protein